MQTAIIIAAIGIAFTAFLSLYSAPSATTEAEFRTFLEVNRVGYGSTDEYNYRLGVFNDNLKKIEELNQANPEATFGVNQFADRTQEEMEVMMGLRIPAGRRGVVNHVAPTGTAQAVDWTNMWTTVKNQGNCGSCWAFSATAAFESRFALNSGSSKVDTLFAEQELVDCDPQSEGCNGGWMDWAFEYLQSSGFCTGAQYPYTARDGVCQADKCGSGPTDKAYVDIAAGNENSLLDNLATGPVSVAVDASTWSFYRSGIMSFCNKNLNHGVTLVKYTPSENSVTLRNSWGANWGENGHIRLKVGQDTCGYSDVASYPTF